jgi:hypothetical protein
VQIKSVPRVNYVSVQRAKLAALFKQPARPSEADYSYELTVSVSLSINLSKAGELTIPAKTAKLNYQDRHSEKAARLDAADESSRLLGKWRRTTIR